MVNDMLITVKLPYPMTNGRTVRVFVPRHEEGETFPVVYMTDGQTSFERLPGELGCWSTHEAVKEEIKSFGRGAIIVGIHNDLGPAQRASELTLACIGEQQVPEEMKGKIPSTGEVFEDFVLNTVMPYVEKHFPVRKGRSNTAFCGSSSGGVESLYLAMSRSDIFGMAGVFSPALMIYSPMDLEKWFMGCLGENKPYIYLYSGGEPGLEAAICQFTEMLGAILERSYPSDLFKKVIIKENPHNETAWAKAFKDMLHIFLDN